MAARKRKVKLTETWKDGLRATIVMKRLYDCALGEIDMTSEQLSAAKTILAKMVPDLARVDNTLSAPEGGPVDFSAVVSFKKPTDSKT
jgi:hypothetical protein